MGDKIHVLSVSTSDSSGGAARAAYRIHLAVQEYGIDSRMFVKKQETADDRVSSVSDFVPLEKLGKPVNQLHFRLLKNGEQVQTGDTSQMLFGVDRIISYLSQYMTLRTGDYIFTGTPAGVGPVQIGDVLEGFLEDLPLLKCRIK